MADVEKHAKQYGEMKTKDYIPGVEALLRKEAEGEEVRNNLKLLYNLPLIS